MNNTILIDKISISFMTKYGEVNRTFADPLDANYFIECGLTHGEPVLTAIVNPEINIEWEDGSRFSIFDHKDFFVCDKKKRYMTIIQKFYDLVYGTEFLDTISNCNNKSAILEALVLVDAILNGFQPFDQKELREDQEFMQEVKNLKWRLTNALAVRNKRISNLKTLTGN